MDKAKDLHLANLGSAFAGTHMSRCGWQERPKFLLCAGESPSLLGISEPLSKGSLTLNSDVFIRTANLLHICIVAVFNDLQETYTRSP